MIFSQLKALIAHTILLSFSFCTNAQHTDLLELDGFQRHVFIADIITTYKGLIHKQISYEMFVESGEDVMFNSAPIYLALCKNLSGSYYWPGTGSEFKPTPVIDAWINENRDSLKLARTHAGCCD